MQNGYIIAEARVKRGITQEDMAHLLDISLNTYKGYEENKQPIKIEQLNVISNLFDMSLDYLLNISNCKTILKKEKIADEIDYRYLKFSLKYHRRIRRIRQRELAQEFKMSPTTISAYERYANNVTITYLVNFAKKFHISIDYMCGKTRKKEIL